MAPVESVKSRLLIVDDEKSICDILSQYLHKKGYEIAVAASGEKAIEILEKDGADLVLTDIKMPRMSGVDLLKWVKEFDRTLPVIMTTGYPTLDTAVEALKLGAFDYLTKPFHLEEISEKIRRALANKRLEEENLLFSKLVSLHEVTKVLASTYQPTELNRKFIDYSIRLSRADGGVLMFQYGPGNINVVDSSGARFDRAFWGQSCFKQAAKWVTNHEEPLVIEQGRQTAGMTVALPEQLQSCIVFPLKTPKRNIGVLQLARRWGREPFSSVELEIINVLTSQAGISIENVHLYQNIRDNYLKTIRAFALAVEAKDRYTHGHSEMVMKYAVVIAREMKLPDPEVDHVKYAGLLHDIGKIGVSEQILNKPGRLTPEEFMEIKKHPDMGVRIIAEVPFLKSLVPLVRHHHEFYNGKGYPEGLSGENIPLGARILAVADAYEAMTSDRPYRKSLTQQQGMEILNAERGQQFDSTIVDVFLRILNSGYDFTRENPAK